MMPAEIPLVFSCGEARLFGVCVVPARPAAVGVVVVVGGPQYRTGAHRQFTLLARSLGAEGIASLRFDQRGMGDSTGTAPGFEAIGDDIRAAVDALMATVPGLCSVVLWGLCDGASAAAFYGFRDHRVSGLVLANPWVRTERGEARAYLKAYYLRRLVDRAFWQKVLRGEWRLGRSLAAFLAHLRVAGGDGAGTSGDDRAADLPGRVLASLRRFRGRILFILSGKDFVAEEFRSLLSSAPGTSLPAGGQVSRVDLGEADHTFSTEAWRDAVAQATARWILDLLPPADSAADDGR